MRSEVVVATCALCGGVGNAAVCWTAGLLLHAGAVESGTNEWELLVSCIMLVSQSALVVSCIPNFLSRKLVCNWLSACTASPAGSSSCCSTVALSSSCMMLCMYCMAFGVAAGLSQPVALNRLLLTVSSVTTSWLCQQHCQTTGSGTWTLTLTGFSD